MAGFFVLDVPEFASLLRAVEQAKGCIIHPAANGYWFLEFDMTMTIRRSDTGMSEAVWFGCLTAGLMGKIVRFDRDILELIATNEPILGPS